MQMSQILSNVSSEMLSGPGPGGGEPGASGESFGDLQRRIHSDSGSGRPRSMAAIDGGEAGKGGKPTLSRGDVLMDAEGDVVGRIVEGDNGKLGLLLQGSEGDPISLERLMGLFGKAGTELLRRFMNEESLDKDQLLAELGVASDSRSGNDETSGLIAALESMDGQQRQGVLTALAGMLADDGSADGQRLAERLGLAHFNNEGSGISLVRAGSGNRGVSGLVQAFLNGEFSPADNNADRQASASFDALRAGVGNSSGNTDTSESSARSEMVNLLQQNAARAQDGREAPLKQYTTSVETPVQQQVKWGEQVAGKIAWMAGKSIQSADIQLNPPEMGPIDVRVQVHNEQASITVNAQNNQIRDMLELNSNRLREMLEENGMDLAEFDVSGNESDGGEDSEGNGTEGQQGGSSTMISQRGETVSAGEMSIDLPAGIDTYA